MFRRPVSRTLRGLATFGTPEHCAAVLTEHCAAVLRSLGGLGGVRGLQSPACLGQERSDE